MSSRPVLRMAFAVPVAAGVISCAGPPATGPAAQQQSIGSTQVTGGDTSSSTGEGAASSAAGRTTSSARPAPTGGARPGGPDPGAGSGGAGRPGGPFDVEAFENRGQGLADFRPFGADHCSGGRCVLVEKTSPDPDAQEGCEIADFAYDPPARPADAPPSEQFIQRGTTVTVFVHCPPDAGGSSGESAGSGSSAASESASESSSGAAGA